MLLATSDYVPAKIASAVANAEGNWIMGQGEPDGRGVSVAQAVINWGLLVNDASILANPQIKLVSPYQQGDGSAGGSYLQQFLTGITAAGFRLPDAIACDRYNTIAFLTQQLNNYHTAFPTYEIWIPEFCIDTGAAGGGASMATEIAYLKLISMVFDRMPWVTHYAVWYNGPSTWNANNFTLRALYDNSAAPTALAPVWRECGKFLP